MENDKRKKEAALGFLSEFNTKTEQTPECNDLHIITQAMSKRQIAQHLLPPLQGKGQYCLSDTYFL